MCKNEAGILSITEEIKLQVAAKIDRIRRYKQRGKQFRQNKLLKDTAKQVCKEISQKQIDVNDQPIIIEIEHFWSRIWDSP